MKIILKPHREDSLRRRHPWIFSGAIDRIETPVPLGETVDIFSAHGEWLARGSWSPHSQIRVRVWTFEQAEIIDDHFFQRRLQKAIENRSRLAGSSTALRLVYSESDGLPGVIVDRYGDFVVCQFLSAGADYWREVIIRQLRGIVPGAGFYERSEGKSREKEGLAPRHGVSAGGEPPDVISIMENRLLFFVDIKKGHKTGFYLDQRDNRAALAPLCANAEVLNCFSYSGGFAVYALRGGAAHVTNIDTSQPALDLAHRNIEINGFDRTKTDNLQGDAFQLLRRFREQKRSFDVIVLDPPKFAESAGQVKTAARGYKDINMLAIQLLQPGGLLMTFSCSGHIAPPLFQKIVADAALDARREVHIIRRLFQAEDHPLLTSFPESCYLKGLMCRMV